MRSNDASEGKKILAASFECDEHFGSSCLINVSSYDQAIRGKLKSPLIKNLWFIYLEDSMFI